MPRIPSPPSPSAAAGPATVSGLFTSPFANAGFTPTGADALGAEGDMPMIVVPAPAATLGPPPRPEAPGLSALFDDIPRSDPSIPIPRAALGEPPAAAFEIDVDIGIDAPAGGLSGDAGQDDPTVDLPHAFGVPPPPEEPPPEGVQPLGAALVAAFEHNRTAPVDVGQVIEVAQAGAFSLDTEQSTMSMPSPIVVRLRDLQQRLVTEGRATDAEIIAQALALLESGGA